MRKRNNGGGRMLDILRAMDAYTAHDSGGVEEVAQAASEPRCADCGGEGVATITDEHGEQVTLCAECHDYWQTNIAPLLSGGAANEPRCAIAGCDEWPVTTCVCCNRDVCSGDIVGADDLGPGICSDCLFTCAGGMACQVVSHE